MTHRSGPARRLVALLLLALTVVAAAVPHAAAWPPIDGSGHARRLPGQPAIDDLVRSGWLVPGVPVDLRFSVADPPAGALIQVSVLGPAAPPVLAAAVARPAEVLTDGRLRLAHRFGPVPLDLLERDPAVGAGGGYHLSLPTAATAGTDPAAFVVDGSGLYVFAVEVLDANRQVVTATRLPFLTDTGPTVELAVVVDVASALALQPDGTTAIADDEVDRLGGVIELADQWADPLDLVVRPVADTVTALLASPRYQARGATVVGGSDGATTTTPGPTDRTPLHALLARRPSLVATAVPADIGAVVAAGLQALAGPLLDRDAAAVQSVAGTAPDRSLFLADGPLGEEAAQALAGSGVTAIAMGPDGFADGDVPHDGAPVAVEGVTATDGAPLRAVLVDPFAGSLLTDPDDEVADGSLPSDTVAWLRLAALHSRFSAAPATVVARVDEVSPAPAGPAIAAATFSLIAASTTAFTTVPVSEVATRAAGPAVGLAPAPSGDDLAIVAERLPEVGEKLRAFTALTTIDGDPSPPRVPPLDLPLAQQASAALATGVDDERRVAHLTAVEATATRAFDAVGIGGATTINLTSRRGSLPITVRNGNPFPIKVLVRVRSDRLRFPQGDVVELIVAGEQARVDIPVETRASGSLPTSVTVTTPDGGVVLVEAQLNVRSTTISGVGWTLSIGALVVLLVWWLRHSRTNRRRQEPSDPGPGRGVEAGLPPIV